MINKKTISVCALVVLIFTSCSSLSKKELENSFVVKVSADKLLLSLSNNNKDEKFLEAINVANEKQRVSSKNYITLFGRAFSEVDPDAKLAPIFSTIHLRNRISFNTNNEEVINVLKGELNEAIDKSVITLSSRIHRYGIHEQNIKRIDSSDNILIELPALENIDRVKELIETNAKLEFWETYECSEVLGFISDANEVLSGIDISGITELLKSTEQDVPPLDRETIQNMRKASESDANNTKEEITNEDDKAFNEFEKKYPIFTVLEPAILNDGRAMQGPVVGFVSIQDTAIVNYFFNSDIVKEVLPKDLRLYWAYKPLPQDENIMQLFAIKVTSRDGIAPLDGLVITDVTNKRNQNDNTTILLSMNSEGARIWQRLTRDNIGRSIAITLDDYVYAFHRVQSEIQDGQASIVGQFTEEETQILVSILQTGALPAPVTIIEENLKKE